MDKKAEAGSRRPAGKPDKKKRLAVARLGPSTPAAPAVREGPMGKRAPEPRSRPRRSRRMLARACRRGAMGAPIAELNRRGVHRTAQLPPNKPNRRRQLQ